MHLKIAVVDDHELLRNGLRATLETHPGWKVVAEAGDGRRALAIAETIKPDIAVMDVSMPELNGLEATREFLKLSPRTRVLILISRDSGQAVGEVLASGARGCLLKSDKAADLIAAVEALADGRTFFTQRMPDLLLNGRAGARRSRRCGEDPEPRLSARETEVVQLLAEGKSNKEIAGVLNLSVKTVETHRSNIMNKLGMRSFSELIRYAIRTGIVPA